MLVWKMDQHLPSSRICSTSPLSAQPFLDWPTCTSGTLPHRASVSAASPLMPVPLPPAHSKWSLTRTEVIMCVCPCRTATGTAVCRHQMRISLSQLPTASSVLLALHAMSVISAAWPRNVHTSRPVSAVHTFTRWSSAPCHHSRSTSNTLNS